MERADIANNPNLIEDINNLNNIIAYENANVLLAKANAPVQTKDFPEDILTAEIPVEKDFTQMRDAVLSPEQFQQLATSLINVKNNNSPSNLKLF